VVPKSFELGYLAARWMDQLTTTPSATTPPGSRISIGIELVTKSNVQAFLTTRAEQQKAR
jgi:hypothetical protein